MGMTGRQKVLKTLYPIFSVFNYLTGRGTSIRREKNAAIPPSNIYEMIVDLNNGTRFSLDNWKGKKILIVNTASNCGYTPQYEELQELKEMFEGRLEVIAFPANDFKEQEKGTDDEIASFCRKNYGVTFPLASKSSVKHGPGQNPVFQWLTQKERNGWNNFQPPWNFSKYLISEDGRLLACFDPSVSPISKEMLQAIEG
ncbi:glutathione peroxidase [Pollutibacter soli]|uniref:glutathione peroxidase n=1 Tax=Pollutibacter soli TaxID=3034157 RepID=UPI003013E475